MDNGLGRRIRRAREAARLTQGALAALLEVDQRSVGNWERGKHAPGSRLGALEQVLGVDLSTGEPLGAGDPVYRAVYASPLSKAAQLRLLSHYEDLLAAAGLSA